MSGFLIACMSIGALLVVCLLFWAVVSAVERMWRDSNEQ